MIRAVPRGGAPAGPGALRRPGRQPAAYGFATDGRTFYCTVGSHESDVWVMELGRRDAPPGYIRGTNMMCALGVPGTSAR